MDTKSTAKDGAGPTTGKHLGQARAEEGLKLSDMADHLDITPMRTRTMQRETGRQQKDMEAAFDRGSPPAANEDATG